MAGNASCLGRTLADISVNIKQHFNERLARAGLILPLRMMCRKTTNE